MPQPSYVTTSEAPQTRQQLLSQIRSPEISLINATAVDVAGQVVE